MPALFDAHCHLQNLGAAQAAEALDQARRRGVTQAVCCGTSEEDWPAVLDLATRHREVLPMLGVHPWRLKEATPGWPARLEERLRVERAGLGECGLDFAQREADREVQATALRLHLRLAKALHRPIALHCVRAWGPLLTILREEGLPDAGAMVHAFGGSAEVARELQSLGLFLSFAPGADLPEGSRPRAALLAVRDDRLLLESDAPMRPGSLHGDLAGPARIADWAEAVATARGCSVSECARMSRENGLMCFQEILP